MAEQTGSFPLLSAPGIERDGTPLDGMSYQDGQWVRFMRGRPRKMGGYRSMTSLANGPLRAMLVDSRTNSNVANLFSPYGIERMQFDVNGSGGGLIDRTPDTFSVSELYTWTVDSMYDSQGATAPVMVAAATPDLADIASEEVGPIYYGDIRAETPLVPLNDGTNDILTAGGIVVLQPFLFIYGVNGEIRNTDANNLSTTGLTPGGSSLANIVNVAGTKIVFGLPMRGGSASPSGLFWGLDSLIRTTFVGGDVLFQYDTLSKNISVMSKKGIIEYDGIFFWLGVDRFYVYDGTVHELLNNTNFNWFFDGLNFLQRQKVWSMKVPRFGEIWWFFPRGEATECTHAIIFNVREKVWYDVELSRSTGFPAQVFQYPIMAGLEDRVPTRVFAYTAVTGVVNINETVHGGTSGASGKVAKITATKMYLVDVVGVFLSGETVTSTGGGTATVDDIGFMASLEDVWQHEFEHDKIRGQNVNAIRSYIDSAPVSYLTGGPSKQQLANIVTRITRVEPDFVQKGPLNFYVKGSDYANGKDVTSEVVEFTNETKFFDVKEQRRFMYIRIESNTAGGFFEFGKTLLKLEPGDIRP